MTLEAGNETGTVETGASVENAGAGLGDVTPPRKRGRPPGSGKKTEGEKPAAVPGGDAPASGAKRGPKKRQKEFTDADVSSLAKQVQGLHALGAMVTGIPELAIAEAEAVALSKGVVAVAKEYDLEISGKTGAMIQLAAACAAVYLPRLLAVKARAAQARAAKGTVVDGQFSEVTHA